MIVRMTKSIQEYKLCCHLASKLFKIRMLYNDKNASNQCSFFVEVGLLPKNSFVRICLWVILNSFTAIVLRKQQALSLSLLLLL